jgi:hypothetical protein
VHPGKPTKYRFYSQLAAHKRSNILDNVVAKPALIANLLQVMLNKVYQEQIGPKS